MTDFNEKLRKAARNGSELVLKALLREPGCDASSKDKFGMTALMYASYRGHEACVQLLLPVSDPLSKSKDGMTALMHAAWFGHESCVRLLLPVSDALASDKDGMTALMRAAGNDSEACTRLLLPVSDVQARDSKGLTASSSARSRCNERVGIFIDAYVLAQSEQAAIGAAASPGAPSKKSGLRV